MPAVSLCNTRIMLRQYSAAAPQRVRSPARTPPGSESKSSHPAARAELASNASGDTSSRLFNEVILDSDGFRRFPTVSSTVAILSVLLLQVQKPVQLV